MLQEYKEILVFYVNKQVIVYNKSIDLVRQEIEQQYEQNENDLVLKQIYIQILYQYDNDTQKALKLIKEVLQQDQFNIDARLDLTILLLQYDIGNHEQCLKIIKECIDIDSNYWRIYIVQMKYHDSILTSNQYMFKEIKKLVQRFPNNVWLTVYYWQILGDDEKEKFQKVDLDIVLKSEYLDFEQLRRVAYYLQDIGLADLALECEKRSVQLNPKGFQTLNNYGYLMRANKSDYSECIKYCQRALSINPRYVMALTNLGFTYQALQQYELSNECFKKIITINNNKSIFYQNLILNYYGLFDKQNEIYYCQKGARKFPNCLEISKYHSFTLMEQQLNQTGKDLEGMQLVYQSNINKIPQQSYEYQYFSVHLNDIF